MSYVHSKFHIVLLCFNPPAVLTALALVSPGGLLRVFSAALCLQCCTCFLRCARWKSIDSVEWEKKSSRELSKGKVTERAEGRKIIVSQSHVWIQQWQQWQLWFDETTCDNLTSCSSRLLQAANISSWVETYLLGSAGLAMGNQACCAKSNDEKAWAAWILSCAGNSTVTQGVFSWYDS